MEENKLDTNEEMLNRNVTPVSEEQDALTELDDSTEDQQENHENPEEAAALAELEEEEHEKFDTASLEHLRETLKGVLHEDRIRDFRKAFSSLKRRFQVIYDEEKNKMLQKFLDEGEKAEDFQFYAPEDMMKVRELIGKFKDRVAEIRKREDQELQANYLAKQDVIHELKLLISEEPDIKKAFDSFQKLQEKWRSIGAVPSQYAQELWNNYKFYTDKFYEFVQINKELYEMDLAKNLSVKQQLIQRVEELAKVSSIKKSIEILHAIQKEWRETGPVPKAVSKETFDQFKAAVDTIYMRRDGFIKEREEIRQKNLEAKIVLCEQAEKFAAENPKTINEWRKLETGIKKVDDKWKTIGRVPLQFNDSIWDRFKAARRDFYRKKLPLLKHAKEELNGNYNAKVQLCEKAEALKDSTDWKNTTLQLIRLQNEWKKTGSVDRKRSDEIWARFRGACDAFFQAKDQYFAGQGEREAGNLEKKKEVIEKLKAYAPVESLDENMGFIRGIQQEWGAIGYVPMGEKNGIEKAFDEAMNGLLAKLNIDKDKKHRMEYKVKIDTMLQSQQAESLLIDERMHIGNRIRKLEEEITQIGNNLGFFGHSKGANTFKQQYEEKIEKLKQELSIYTDRRTLIKNALKALETK